METTEVALKAVAVVLLSLCLGSTTCGISVIGTGCVLVISTWPRTSATWRGAERNDTARSSDRRRRMNRRRTAAVLMSICASCKQPGVNAFAYFRDPPA